MIVIRMDGPLAHETTADRVEAAFAKMPFFQTLIFERDLTSQTDRPHFQVRGPRRLLDYRLAGSVSMRHGESVLSTISRTLLEQTIGFPVEPIYTEEWLTQVTHPFPVF